MAELPTAKEYFKITKEQRRNAREMLLTPGGQELLKLIRAHYMLPVMFDADPLVLAYRVAGYDVVQWFERLMEPDNA